MAAKTHSSTSYAKAMAQAVNAVRNGSMTYRAAAAKYNVPKASLHDNASGKHQNDGESYEKCDPSQNRRLFTDTEETAMVKWFLKKAMEGQRVTMDEARVLVMGLLEAKFEGTGRVPTPPSRSFWRGFFRRHSTEVCGPSLYRFACFSLSS